MFYNEREERFSPRLIRFKRQNENRDKKRINKKAIKYLVEKSFLLFLLLC